MTSLFAWRCVGHGGWQRQIPGLTQLLSRQFSSSSRGHASARQSLRIREESRAHPLSRGLPSLSRIARQKVSGFPAGLRHASWGRQENDETFAQSSRLAWIGLAMGAGVVLVYSDTLISSTQCESGWYTEPRDRAKGRHKDTTPIAENEKKITDYYELLDELGSGVHATVRIGKNKETGERVAVKCVDKSNMRRRQLAREIEILTTVNHPNIISLKDVFEDDTYVYLVLELVEVGLSTLYKNCT
jgi:hypothetical protein